MGRGLVACVASPLPEVMKHISGTVDPLQSTLCAIIYGMPIGRGVEFMGGDRSWVFKLCDNEWCACSGGTEFWSGKLEETAEYTSILLKLISNPEFSIRITDRGGLAVLKENSLVVAALVAKELETTE